MPNDSAIDKLALTETPEGTCFHVFVQPRSSRIEICGIQGDALKVRLTSPPVEDAANRQLAEFIAKSLGIAKSKVSIIAGEKSRRKRVLAKGVSKETILSSLLPSS